MRAVWRASNHQSRRLPLDPPELFASLGVCNKVAPSAFLPDPSMSSDTSRARLIRNPFYVLELSPDCTRAEVERAGQKLLAMLELNLPESLDYRTPYGSARRTPDEVRKALADLRDPERRLLHELWARAEPWPHPVAPPESPEHEPWEGARSALGWRRW
jgi:hypothetical protein